MSVSFFPDLQKLVWLLGGEREETSKFIEGKDRFLYDVPESDQTSRLSIYLFPFLLYRRTKSNPVNLVQTIFALGAWPGHLSMIACETGQ